MQNDLNAGNLIVGYTHNFLHYQLAELVADFALPLPIFRGRELRVLTTVSEISSLFFNLRRDAERLGMTDFQGQMLHCVTEKQNLIHMRVDWTYFTPCQKKNRGTSVNYFISNQSGQPIIEMVEIFPCNTDSGERKDMKINIPTSTISLERDQNLLNTQISPKPRTIH